MQGTTRRKLILLTTFTLLIALYVLTKIGDVWHRGSLPGDLSARMELYKTPVKKYADQYGLDWLLICAVIRQESGFNPRAKSSVGAKGLMQLMPGTAKELGIRNPYHPERNIAAGVRYLRQQYDRFPKSQHTDRVKLALASYNGGVGHVFDARALAQHAGEDANRWEAVRPALGKLTHKHKSLHRRVWRDGRPEHGYFPGYRQTVAYVDRVIGYYERFSREGR
ncbi:MAG: transglycosylase SLT domain-containing protein [Candidatus Poribacteria bacterium]|nr:transglycosylase SLT domain-containing protein [Candidatus Poribacteria bacterium]